MLNNLSNPIFSNHSLHKLNNLLILQQLDQKDKHQIFIILSIFINLELNAFDVIINLMTYLFEFLVILHFVEKVCNDLLFYELLENVLLLC